MALVGAHDISIWGFSPYPGSELFTRLMTEGKVSLSDAFFDSLRSFTDMNKATSYSEHISSRKLGRLQFYGTALFYGIAWLRRPWRPFRALWNLLTGRYESRAEQILVNGVRGKRLKASDSSAAE